MKTKILVSLLTVLIFTGVAKAGEPLFKTNQFDLALETRPDDLLTPFQTWEGQVATAMAGQVFGIPPELTVGVLRMIIPPFQRRGEDTRGSFQVEPGYKLCNTQVTVHSVIGSRSHCNITSGEGGVGFYAHLPRNRVGQGKSSCHMSVKVLSIKKGKNSRKCRAPNHLYYLCRSGKGNCNGRR